MEFTKRLRLNFLRLESEIIQRRKTKGGPLGVWFRTHSWLRYSPAERNDDEVWNSLFQKAVDIAGDVDVVLAVPDVMVVNKIDRMPQALWKGNILFPFVDHLLVELETRLIQGHGRFCAQKLIPFKIQNDGLPWESIADVYQAFYACLDTDETIFVRECKKWRMWWTDRTLVVDRPAAPVSLAESITLASKALYPSIRR
ncbi:hypothetical protein MAR_019453 [Mya arenaria]|uniref:Uncharacterized protein n=1 Tax=Mya arenaria TaxID=6604 RepID=A0ABY7E6M9_MYAAR|nr:hypothetical protein MAR_019453 [Mya arenaria]